MIFPWGTYTITATGAGIGIWPCFCAVGEEINQNWEANDENWENEDHLWELA